MRIGLLNCWKLLNRMVLVVRSSVKKVVEMNVGEDLVAALDRKVEDVLKKAEERAKANGRRTVYARDL